MVNHLVFQGRMVEDVKSGQTQAGMDYANFRIAWSRKFKDRDGNEKENRCFLDCKAFGGTARFINQYLSAKGTELIAEGELNTETWQTQEGQNRSKTVLMVSGAHFCGSRRDGSTAGGSAGNDAGNSTDNVQPNLTPMEVNPDDLPF